MSLVAKESSGGSNFIQVPAGIHLARLYRIIDLGTQESEYMGTKKQLHKVMFQFEVHSEDEQGNPTQTSEGKPLSLSKTYTLTLSERSSLRKDLESWRGKPFTETEKAGFEIKNVLGVWAMLSVTVTSREGNSYTNIASVMPVLASIKKAGLPEGVNPTKIFYIQEPDMDLFDSFSDKLKEKIRKSPEWESVHGVEQIASNANSADFEDMENDLPF
jgi:hypothetical protein